MDRKQLHQALVSHLIAKPWISDEEAEEIKASLSHWLQNPESHVPFFNNSMRYECISYIHHAQADNLRTASNFRIGEPQKPYQYKLNLPFDDVPYPPPAKWDFTFIDLFAGIGGFRLAFQEAGGKCVFTSEWDRYAQTTYEANFGEYPYGDIRRIIKSEIPDHDVLCAGFPCQPFSLAGA